MTTDTTERGLERLICTAMAGSPCDSPAPGEVRQPFGTGWICGAPEDNDRAHVVDLLQLRDFLEATQPDAADAADLGNDSPVRFASASEPLRFARLTTRSRSVRRACR